MRDSSFAGGAERLAGPPHCSVAGDSGRVKQRQSEPEPNLARRFQPGDHRADDGSVQRRLNTIPRASQRTITVSYAHGIDERYALFRFRDGDVGWRLDEFRFSDDPGEPASWSDSYGRLTVAEVVQRLPGHARLVHEWTRKEVQLGTVVVDDIFTAMTREEALTRLTAQLTASEASGRQSA